MAMITVAEQYDELVSLVREGYLPLAPEARKHALQHDLPLAPLDSALKDAYRALLTSYVNQVDHGRMDLTIRAYQIARDHDIFVEELGLAGNLPPTAESSH
jgi:hypothetical protein